MRCGIPKKNTLVRPKFKLVTIVRSKERETGPTKGFKKVIIWIFVEKDSSIGNIKMQRSSRQSIYQVCCCSEGKIPKLERQ